ncbi:alanine/ornithine racemase family PLP-dependent enzyme [Chitinivorax sp. PXF-14]|uniref:alanine/ornithine racemase family PLP-dependent enzyme n=1 Tax=Chitinivorax sp. PXF-14 TaxID=3230488 RepID=UPI003467B027
MIGAHIDIHLDRIEHNARVLVEACQAAGIAVAGVTKSTCGSPRVAQAMVRGGVAQIADSRLDNLARLRRAGVTAPLLLLRAPSPLEVEAVLRHADISLQSELSTLRLLSQRAVAAGIEHDVILMIELGDLREGIMPADVMAHVEQVLALPGLHLLGLGANLACVSGIQPTVDNLGSLAHLAAEARRRFGIALPLVSGGNTFSLPLLEQGLMPAGINHLRLGASIMMAESPTPPGLAARLRKDAFVVRAPVIEAKIKPGRPYGVAGENAFGVRPDFGHLPDRPSRRLILAIGREDVLPPGLSPLDARLSIVGASSDHLVLDAGDSTDTYGLGAEIGFTVDYGALLMAMTSPYVGKRYRAGRPAAPGGGAP